MATVLSCFGPFSDHDVTTSGSGDFVAATYPAAFTFACAATHAHQASVRQRIGQTVARDRADSAQGLGIAHSVLAGRTDGTDGAAGADGGVSVSASQLNA